MRPDKQNVPSTAFFVVLGIPVIWFGLLCGSCAAPGRSVFEWMDAVMAAMQTPFQITVTAYSARAVLIALLAYVCAAMLWVDSNRRRRPGVEHGSAAWGKAKQVCAKYRYHVRLRENIRAGITRLLDFLRSLMVFLHRGRQTEEEKAEAEVQKALHLPCDMNFPLTQDVCIGLDMQRHRRNLNVMVVGGSGAGKSRFFCKPGLMQANCSYLVCDPKGELLRDCAPLLIQRGYTGQSMLARSHSSPCRSPSTCWKQVIRHPARRSAGLSSSRVIAI